MSTQLKYILSQLQLPEQSVKNTIELLNEDCTIPFISRYRKERTGNLDEVQIGDIVKYKEQFEALEKRKKAILKALEEQDVLTSELKHKIKDTQAIILANTRELATQVESVINNLGKYMKRWNNSKNQTIFIAYF